MFVKPKSAAFLAVFLALAAPFGCGGGDDAPVNPLAPSPTGGGVPPDTATGWSAASPPGSVPAAFDAAAPGALASPPARPFTLHHLGGYKNPHDSGGPVFWPVCEGSSLKYEDPARAGRDPRQVGSWFREHQPEQSRPRLPGRSGVRPVRLAGRERPRPPQSRGGPRVRAVLGRRSRSAEPSVRPRRQRRRRRERRRGRQTRRVLPASRQRDRGRLVFRQGLLPDDRRPVHRRRQRLGLRRGIAGRFRRPALHVAPSRGLRSAPLRQSARRGRAGLLARSASRRTSSTPSGPRRA